MKITIEIEVPDDSSTYSLWHVVRAAEKAASPDWHGSWWNIDDIKNHAEDMGEALFDREAREVLEMMDRYHDCGVGLNWDSIGVWIDMVISEREEA